MRESVVYQQVQQPLKKLINSYSGVDEEKDALERYLAKNKFGRMRVESYHEQALLVKL